jgi:imidazolonepropionase-like amidohydrolase
VKPRRLLFNLFALLSLSAFAADILPPGHRPLPHGTHALAGGKVVVKPGEVVEGATIIVRDGFIQAVGKDLNPPPDARVWDLKGTTIYAGFVDPCLTLDSTNRPVANATVQFDDSLTAGGLGFYGVPGSERDPGQAGPGYRVSQIIPEARVARGFSPDPKALETVRELGFATGNVVPQKGIVRGTSAFVALSDVSPNEAIIKADTFHHIAFEAEGGRDDGYPRSLMGVIAVTRQTFFDARHYVEANNHFRRNGQGAKRPEFNPSLEALTPAIDKKMAVVIEPGSALMDDRAARVARELNLDLHLVACGQEWRRPDLTKATGASFIVPLDFPELPKMPEEDDWEAVSLDQLRAWDWAAENAALLRQQGMEIALTTYGLGDKKNFRKNLQAAIDRGLSESDALAALTTVPARLCGVAERVGTIEAGKIANLTVVEGDSYFNPENKVREVWIDGRVYPVRRGEAKPSEKQAASDGDKEEKSKQEKKKKQDELRELRKKRIARSPMEGRGPLAEPPAVLIRGATVWTSTQQGRLENADLLIVNGKIQSVGKSLTAPAAALIIDGKDKHVTPGVIDCHNHSMALGSVNEGTLPSSAMVRIADVVNSESLNIHKQLAGGLTTLNLLHGSANPIGGQNAVLKLRDGAAPEDLKFASAPAGIKFALGENVKQSNATRTNRFPQTRMGVRTFFANRFTAARQYLKEQDNYSKSGPASPLPPPRRDLELEALGEIIQGKRWIHCHSYRQDEILSFLRTMESFGVKVGTLQHVLEGYKVADEIAKHGAGASCFSDWWAYKFEVYDAIPYAGSLMRDRGVVVSFNSDSSDLSRRLYLEAAKAVKYGATSEEEALKFVTLNPAKQLRIDQYVGSLEPGKDGDFVIWSKSPLDSSTVCLQTWIEGKKYFDRDNEAARTEALEKERADLLAKAKKLASGGGAVEGGQKEKDRFFELPLEHRFDFRDQHCMDDEESSE